MHVSDAEALKRIGPLHWWNLLAVSTQPEFIEALNQFFAGIFSEGVKRILHFITYSMPQSITYTFVF